MEKILVSVGGVILVAFVYWFFFGKKPSFAEASYARADASEGQGRIDIVVDGGYKPEAIKIKRGEKVTLSLLRKDPNPCLEEFILPDFKIKKYLPIGKTVDVEITPELAGTFGFHCGMNMFHGKVVVE